MSIDLDDLIGLNMTTVHDMPVIGHASVAANVLLAFTDKLLSIAVPHAPEHDLRPR